MNKAGKMAAIIVAALVPIYLGATWYTGRLAHQRTDAFVAKLTEQLKGQIKVVKRTTSTGMFSSVEDITLAIENPMFAALVTEDSMPSEFTFHNVISHGPLPGLRSVGIARIESSLVLTDEVRSKLKKVLGTDRPLAVAVTLGWTGSIHIDVTSPKMNVKLPKNEGTLQWQGLDATMNYSGDFSHIAIDASLPGIKVATTNGMVMDMTNLKVAGDLNSKFETLFVGDEAITMESIRIDTPRNALTGAPPSRVSMRNVAYLINLNADGDYLNMDAKLGAAAYEGQNMHLKDIHFDFGTKHLHGPSTAKLVKAFQDYSKQVQARVEAQVMPLAGAKSRTDTADDAAVNTSATPAVVDLGSPPNMVEMKSHVIAVLQQKPELVIEHIGFASKDGAIKISGRAHLDEVTEQDFGPQVAAAQLLGKVIATADVQLSKGILVTLGGAGGPNVDQTVAQFEQQGYLVRKGDQWEAHLEFKKGALTVNGKKIGGP